MVNFFNFYMNNNLYISSWLRICLVSFYRSLLGDIPIVVFSSSEFQSIKFSTKLHLRAIFTEINQRLWLNISEWHDKIKALIKAASQDFFLTFRRCFSLVNSTRWYISFIKGRKLEKRGKRKNFSKKSGRYIYFKFCFLSSLTYRDYIDKWIHISFIRVFLEVGPGNIILAIFWFNFAEHSS